MTTSITPIETREQLYDQVAEAFCELAVSSVQANGVFQVALSGGSTPKKLYEMLAKRDLPWANMHWFWGDERNVLHDHSDSNYRMVCEALLNHVGVPKGNIHSVPVDVEEPSQAALSYEKTLREHFDDQEYPAWDLALQGMGDDAHTASLFPETEALQETDRWFVENWVEKFDAYRYTLTASAINSAKQIWFLVSGEGKRDALQKVINGEHAPELFPSQMIHASRWFVTSDAMNH